MFYALIILIVIWDLYWKIQSIWHAAKKNEKQWFIVLIIFNTVGLLPIYYLYKRGYFSEE